MDLNIVYIGPISFPLGMASTKRRRYMVDYMNEKGISCHVLCTRDKYSHFTNSQNGYYKRTEYVDLSNLWRNSKRKFYSLGREKLKEWYDDNKSNILIFHTLLYVEEYLFYSYGRHMGYKIVFDQVETSYTSQGTNASFKTRLYIRLCESLSHFAYKKCVGSFVISEALLKLNRKKYPDMNLCLLPNSTPILSIKSREKIGVPIKIFYSGTWAPKDGVKYLIDGVRKAVELGCDCELKLAGKGKSCDMKVLDELDGECEYIKYCGFLSDEELVETMKECDILAMTRVNSVFSNYGFPFKLSEYLATGNLLLATDVGDIHLYLKNKVNAYIVKPEDSQDIANVILDISMHQEEALNIARNGFCVAKEIFGIDRVGNKMITFLQQL